MSKTVSQWLAEATSRLAADGIVNSSGEAHQLLAFAMNMPCKKLLLSLTDPLDETVGASFDELLHRRIHGEPLQYLTGCQEFMALDFYVCPDVLVPRWDTEGLVEMALKAINVFSRPVVADICTGSGAIVVSLARYFPAGIYYASDISAAALEVARKNALRHQVSEAITFLQGDLLQPLQSLELSFDLIVSNPPYIATSEMANLPVDVRWEPDLALDGGPEGLDFYKRLIPQAKALLKPGGNLLLEIGWDQGTAVCQLCQEAGYIQVRVSPDLGGLDRMVSARKPNEPE